jgi:VIT1/CCC1 family predicted Fe2+/Mn2+ transporter
VSVSSQRDSEKSLLARERRELREMPAAELDELAAIYEAKGVSPQTAAQVAAELTAHDALAAHVDAASRLDPDDLANPAGSGRVCSIVHGRSAITPAQRCFGFPSPSSPC